MRILAILFCLALLAISSPAFAAEPATALVCEQAAIAGNSTYTSAPIGVSMAEGFFTLSARQDGTGPVTIGYQVSVNGLDWATPDGAEAIITDMGDGIRITAFDPVYAPWLRIIVSNTGTSEVLATVRVAYR
ncbi:MAG: hypothetical protein HZB23_15555 [Deltaproteobacteria bacterium]|nr:hypothetical protein [Deltaproteobacteria bacterium]